MSFISYRCNVCPVCPEDRCHLCFVCPIDIEFVQACGKECQGCRRWAVTVTKYNDTEGQVSKYQMDCEKLSSV